MIHYDWLWMELLFYISLIPSISNFLTIKSAIKCSFYPIFGHTSAGSGAANEVSFSWVPWWFTRKQWKSVSTTLPVHPQAVTYVLFAVPPTNSLILDHESFFVGLGKIFTNLAIIYEPLSHNSFFEPQVDIFQHQKIDAPYPKLYGCSSAWFGFFMFYRHISP